jgi:hypothetical protein
LIDLVFYLGHRLLDKLNTSEADGRLLEEICGVKKDFLRSKHINGKKTEEVR